LALENLTGRLGVVLDNVNAERIGPDALRSVRRFVQTFGGGLVMTGGQESFGAGGYFKSAIEECLPVSLEVRKEVRKNRMSLVIAMDRSGSMSVPVAGGLQKMDLANNGAIEAINMLGPLDRISVIAVDSAPHVVVKLAAVDEPASLIRAVRKIRSEGGGIFIYEALKAGYDQLQRADTATKHMILFADAADSEEPGDYRKLIALMRHQNMTVSVIGLGTEMDTDAGLLKDIAKLGGGRIFFTARPEELPRLFSYETILADRSAYVDTPVAVKQTPATLAVLPAMPASLPAPALRAYNLGYIKPAAQSAWLTVEKPDSKDEPTALWAFGPTGLGRSTALLFDVNGPHSMPLQSWPGFGATIGAAMRWALESSQAPDAALEVRRVGHDLVATLDIAPALQQRMTTAPALMVVAPETGNEPQRVALRQHPDGTWRATVPLEQTGYYHAVAHLGTHGVARAAPVVLPYSAEFKQWDPVQVSESLRQLVEMTGGSFRTQWTDVFASPAYRPAGMDLRPWLLVLLLAGWVVEISMRRLIYGTTWPRWALKVKLPTLPARKPVAKPEPLPATPVNEPEPKPEEPRGATQDAMSKVKRKR
jgi:hypothetical protein